MSRLIKPKNTLKAKVGHGGFKEENLKKAQVAIEQNRVDFKPIALELLEDLNGAIIHFDLGKGDAEASLGKILDPLMQLRAQGALFHYPSITQVSDVIVDFLDVVKSLDSNIIEILSAYKNAADAILAMNIKSSSDKMCVALIVELKGACKRYHMRKANNRVV